MVSLSWKLVGNRRGLWKKTGKDLGKRLSKEMGASVFLVDKEQFWSRMFAAVLARC